jgi:hypothetical protein
MKSCVLWDVTSKELQMVVVQKIEHVRHVLGNGGNNNECPGCSP